jgi:hypothetical protein
MISSRIPGSVPARPRRGWPLHSAARSAEWTDRMAGHSGRSQARASLPNQARTGLDGGPACGSTNFEKATAEGGCATRVSVGSQARVHVEGQCVERDNYAYLTGSDNL